MQKNTFIIQFPNPAFIALLVQYSRFNCNRYKTMDCKTIEKLALRALTEGPLIEYDPRQFHIFVSRNTMLFVVVL